MENEERDTTTQECNAEPDCQSSVGGNENEECEPVEVASLDKLAEPNHGPFVVVVDSREKKGYNIGESCIETLVIGDYSIRGMEGIVAVERKSHDDLFGCLTVGRSRFIAQLKRMSKIKYPLLVIDATASAIMMGHVFAKISGDEAMRRLQALCMKYNVPYVFADGQGKIITLNHLLLAYRSHNNG